MQIRATRQSSLPPLDKPLVKDPVRVTMDIPLYYMTERGPVPWDHTIFCARAFADTVLYTINGIFCEQQLGFVHLGFYNPRKARRRNGALIEPVRWSNHAYGEAGDWKGIVTQDGEFTPVGTLDEKLFMAVWSGCTVAIRDIGRKPEIINERGWVHIGIWPK